MLYNSFLYNIYTEKCLWNRLLTYCHSFLVMIIDFCSSSSLQKFRSKPFIYSALSFEKILTIKCISVYLPIKEIAVKEISLPVTFLQHVIAQVSVATTGFCLEFSTISEFTRKTSRIQFSIIETYWLCLRSTSQNRAFFTKHISIILQRD